MTPDQKIYFSDKSAVHKVSMSDHEDIAKDEETAVPDDGDDDNVDVSSIFGKYFSLTSLHPSEIMSRIIPFSPLFGYIINLSFLIIKPMTYFRYSFRLKYDLVFNSAFFCVGISYLSYLYRKGFIELHQFPRK